MRDGITGPSPVRKFWYTPLWILTCCPRIVAGVFQNWMQQSSQAYEAHTHPRAHDGEGEVVRREA